MVTLDNEQQQVLEALLRGENVFLTGEAGTGKSTILEEFRQRMEDEDCVFLAPTGIAAVNIHGTTIHSFLEFPPGLLTPETMDDIGSSKKKAIVRATRTIVVDEISMVRSDLFTCMDLRLRKLAIGNAKAKPFGGRQIVVVGDFFQLPPVVKTDVEIEYLQQLGGCYAFQTELWKKANFHCFCLTTVHRQQDDRRFAKILNQIRHGRLLEEVIPTADGTGMTTAAAALNICAERNRSLPHLPVCLTTTNREAQAINAREKARLEGEGGFFQASVTGHFAEGDFPTESALELKPGARVMLLCNKRSPDGEFLYVNGDLGVVTKVNVEESEPVTVQLDKGTEVTVGPNAWSNYEYYMEDDQVLKKRCVRQRVVGTFEQLPLKLAYAVTIHKAQGLTLECVDLKLGNGCFAHGQLYTALSRCRSINGLRISRKISNDDLLLDRDVIEFYKKLNAPAAGAAVNMAIPPEYADAVRELLAKLQGAPPLQAPEPPAPPPLPEPIVEEYDEELPPEMPRRVAIPRGRTKNQGTVSSDPLIDKLMELYRQNALPERHVKILSGIASGYEKNGFIRQWQLAVIRGILH